MTYTGTYAQDPDGNECYVMEYRSNTSLDDDYATSDCTFIIYL